MKYKSEDLENFILAECSIECSNPKCYKGSNSYNSDQYYSAREFFKNGRRATKSGDVYCPECAKKKLEI